MTDLFTRGEKQTWTLDFIAADGAVTEPAILRGQGQARSGCFRAAAFCFRYLNRTEGFGCQGCTCGPARPHFPMCWALRGGPVNLGLCGVGGRQMGIQLRGPTCPHRFCMICCLWSRAPWVLPSLQTLCTYHMAYVGTSNRENWNRSLHFVGLLQS